MSDYVCRKCSYIFSEENGCEEVFEAEVQGELVEGYIRNEDEKCLNMGVSPGTKWEDVPEYFRCPMCGSLKTEFKQRD